MNFFQAMFIVFEAMSAIAVIVGCGFFCFRRAFISMEGVRTLTALMINLFLPCLVIDRFIGHAQRQYMEQWWLFPLLGAVVSGAGFLLAYVVARVLKRMKGRHDFYALVAFQNCGYLPLMLVTSLFSAETAQVLVGYILLFIQGFDCMFWSFGVQLIDRSSRVTLRELVRPPLLAIIASIVIISLGLQAYVPRAVLRAAAGLGACAVPVALLCLGAILGSCSGWAQGPRREYAIVVLTKMVLMPLCALGIVIFFRIPPLLGFLIVMQAAMPAAINLSVVSFYKEGSCSPISRSVLITHVAGLVSIPFFLAVCLMLYPSLR